MIITDIKIFASILPQAELICNIFLLNYAQVCLVNHKG